MPWEIAVTVLLEDDDANEGDARAVAAAMEEAAGILNASLDGTTVEEVA